MLEFTRAWIVLHFDENNKFVGCYGSFANLDDAKYEIRKVEHLKDGEIVSSKRDIMGDWHYDMKTVNGIEHLYILEDRHYTSIDRVVL